MKKIELLLTIKLLAIISINVSFMWIVVEFILYLVKDDEFNWWSVYTLIISLLIVIVIMILATLQVVKHKNKVEVNPKQLRKGSFNERLDKSFKKIKY